MREREWVDITITGRDEGLSEKPTAGDVELRKQVFLLSQEPPSEWAELFRETLSASPGRLGRSGEVSGRVLYVWGGPNIFDRGDAEHLQSIVRFVNDKMSEALQPADHSGFDAFGH